MFKKLLFITISFSMFSTIAFSNYSFAEYKIKKEYLEISHIETFLSYAKENSPNWYLVHKKAEELFKDKIIKPEVLKFLAPFRKDKSSSRDTYLLYEESESVYRDVKTHEVSLSITEYYGIKRVGLSWCLDCKEVHIKINDELTTREEDEYAGAEVTEGVPKVKFLNTSYTSLDSSELKNSTAKRVECSSFDKFNEITALLKEYKRLSLSLKSEEINYPLPNRRITDDIFERLEGFYPVSCAVIKTKKKEYRLHNYIALQKKEFQYYGVPFRLLLIFEGSNDLSSVTKVHFPLFSDGGQGDGVNQYSGNIGDYNNDGYHDIGIVETLYGGASSYVIQTSDDGLDVVYIGSVGWD